MINNNFLNNNNYNIFINYNKKIKLGIGDWAQSPIPNPQSPLLYFIKNYIIIINLKIYYIYYSYLIK